MNFGAKIVIICELAMLNFENSEKRSIFAEVNQELMMKKQLILVLLLLCTSMVQAQQTWRQRVTNRLDSLMKDELLESAQIGMMVWDLTDDRMLFQKNPRYLMRTASTMKALTAITALDCLGGNYKLRTSLYYRGEIADSTLTGELFCEGGMDPLFDDADMQAFAMSVKALGIRMLKARIVCDVSMKDDKKWGEGWCWDDENPTLSPLLIDRKDNFAQRLAEALVNEGISLSDIEVFDGILPEDAQALCTRTHTIDELLQKMMKDSDNLFAEALYYQIAASKGMRFATAADAQKIELALLKKIGLDGSRYRLADGSGLSLYNYLTPECETKLMRYAWKTRDIYDHLFPALPVAGVDGTLEKRMRKTPAQGKVFAKTGTVSGVSTLTGYIKASNGHQLCFAIMMQGLRRTNDGRRLQDSLCIALCDK